MIGGLIIGLLAILSIGLIKLAHGNDAKVKIYQVFLLITALGFWSLSLFFLILGMSSGDLWLCVITSVTVPIVLAVWIFRSRQKMPKHQESNEPNSFEIIQSQTTNISRIKFCRICGEKLIENSNFCRKCGTKIVKENEK